MRGEFGRATGGRGTSASTRGQFSRATSGSPLPLATQAKIMRAADMVAAKANTLHEKHKADRTIKRYGELLSKSGSSRALTPMGTQSDAKARLMSQAASDVATKHSNRLSRIDRARDRMLDTGRVRANRKLDWGKGLAD